METIFLKIIEAFNSGITSISVLINIVTFIFLFVKYIKYFFSLRYFKKLLGFKNEFANISYSIFEPQMLVNMSYSMITQSTITCLEKLTPILINLKQKYYINCSSCVCDEIHIGGPLTNIHVNTYIVNRFKNFKFLTLRNKKEIFDRFPIDGSFIEYNEEKIGFKFEKLNDDRFYEYISKIRDYAILIKICPNDFENDIKKTVHIFFGGSDIGTIKAVEYFEIHYKQIYQKFNTSHYFIAVPINKIDNSFNLFEGIIDLTDLMFP